MISPDFSTAFAALPLVAILRGVKPEEAVEIAAVLVESGFRIIEVPLNSPEPLRSIRAIAESVGSEVLVGAGTVLTAQQANEVLEAGGQLLIAPNVNLAVAQVARDSGLPWCPGVFTATEAFTALDAGAQALKIFPAEAMPPAGIKALRAVLPAATSLLPVGGIGPDDMARYWAAGASGFGLGSALYRPGDTAEKVAGAARRFISALNDLRQ